MSLLKVVKDYLNDNTPAPAGIAPTMKVDFMFIGIAAIGIMIATYFDKAAENKEEHGLPKTQIIVQEPPAHRLPKALMQP